MCTPAPCPWDHQSAYPPQTLAVVGHEIIAIVDLPFSYNTCGDESCSLVVTRTWGHALQLLRTLQLAWAALCTAALVLQPVHGTHSAQLQEGLLQCWLLQWAACPSPWLHT